MAMTTTLDLTPRQHAAIMDLPREYLPGVTVRTYGSRAKGLARPQSDLDLAAFASPQQKRQVSALREAFEQSNLPFRVELFVWDELPQEFRQTIAAEHQILNRD